MRAIFAFTLAGLLAGCNIKETSPQSQVDRLRVLSIRIDGLPDPQKNNAPLAELKPGDTATLTPLVLAPGMALPTPGTDLDMTAQQSVCVEDYYQPRWDRGVSDCPSTTAAILRFWFWCPPQAAILYDDPCTSTDILASPTKILNTVGILPLGSNDSGTCQTPPGPTPAPTACLQLPAKLFDGLAPNDPTRRRGVLMSVLLMTVIDVNGDYNSADPTSPKRLFEKAEAGTIPSVVALKRVPVLENPTNHNPEPAQILKASGPIQSGDLLGRQEPLTVEYPEYPPDDPQEKYLQVNSDGTEEERTERFDIAWLSGFGRFDDSRTGFGEFNLFTSATGSGIDQPPPGPSGSNYLMPIAIVVRDGRGGEGWLVRSVMVTKP